jgi:hypothetical protein
METSIQTEQSDRPVQTMAWRLADAADTNPCQDATPQEFRLGTICSPEEFEQLWAIDREAYGQTSITYDKFNDCWPSFPTDYSGRADAC